jgi:hypothetical protein
VARGQSSSSPNNDDSGSSSSPSKDKSESSSSSKQSQSNDGASKFGDGQSTKGAKPKIYNESTPKEESADVKQHNKEMENRADRATQVEDAEREQKS